MSEANTVPVMQMRSSVEYSPNSIVSKVILKRPNGQVTLFAFDAGEELSEHTTLYEAIISVIDGTAQISIAGQQHTVGVGESIILPANVPHAVKALAQFKMMLTMIK